MIRPARGPPTVPTDEPSARAVARRLARADPVLARVIRSTGVVPLPRNAGGFRHLAEAILYQQISGAAGDAIVRRLEAVDGTGRFPTADWFCTADRATLRRAGVSPQKVGYLQDLARRVVDGRLDLRRLRGASDAAVSEALTAVHGIGGWTAQMYLLFSLHRPDVLPSGDLGVRKAVQRAWGFRTLPAPRTIDRLGRRWAPYRSYATHYLWRSLANRPPLAAEPSRR